MTATLPKALAAALLAVPVLSSCGVSFDAQTDQVYQPADGVNSRSGTVDVLNALIVSETAGTGRLIAGLNNGDTQEDDTLTGVEGVEESADVEVTLGDGDTTIPAGGLLQLADDDAAHVTVTGDEEAIVPGSFVRLTFTFQNGEEATVNVPVLGAGETYSDLDLEPAASPSSPTESPSATPTE